MPMMGNAGHLRNVTCKATYYYEYTSVMAFRIKIIT